MIVNHGFRTYDAKWNYEVVDNQIFLDIDGVKTVIEIPNIEEGDSYKITDIKLPYNPISFVNKVAGEIYVSLFFDDQYTKENPDLTIERKANKGIILPTIEELRESKINEMKESSNKELSKTDYKVIKYSEAVAAKKEPDITEEEFIKLSNERQAIRNKCNQKESEIISALTRQDVKSIVW